MMLLLTLMRSVKNKPELKEEFWMMLLLTLMRSVKKKPELKEEFWMILLLTIMKTWTMRYWQVTQGGQGWKMSYVVAV
ncbi:hypothetical protein V6N11_056979 [Hibiscus sabdariffa]|uniref:Uncharacterized protein n=1 Tax=Hibiscus sabdariffa TaxID=183260 RepID=A0ABR2T6C5_9ROSI